MSQPALNSVDQDFRVLDFSVWDVVLWAPTARVWLLSRSGELQVLGTEESLLEYNAHASRHVFQTEKQREKTPQTPPPPVFDLQEPKAFLRISKELAEMRCRVPGCVWLKLASRAWGDSFPPSDHPKGLKGKIL